MVWSTHFHTILPFGSKDGSSDIPATEEWFLRECEQTCDVFLCKCLIVVLSSFTVTVYLSIVFLFLSSLWYK